jgi:hypothetical protein
MRAGHVLPEGNSVLLSHPSGLREQFRDTSRNASQNRVPRILTLEHNRSSSDDRAGANMRARKNARAHSDPRPITDHDRFADSSPGASLCAANLMRS